MCRTQHDGTRIVLPGFKCRSSDTTAGHVPRAMGTVCSAHSCQALTTQGHLLGQPWVGSASSCTHPAPWLGSESPEVPGQARSSSGMMVSTPPVPLRGGSPVLPALHREAGAGEDLLGSSRPIPCSKQAPEPPQEFSSTTSLPRSTYSKGGVLCGANP